MFQSPSRNDLFLSNIGSSRIVDNLDVKDLTFLYLLEGRYMHEITVCLLDDREEGMEIVMISISLLIKEYFSTGCALR